MKAKKVILFGVLYLVFCFVAMKGAIAYHDHKEDRLVGEFCQTIHYDPEDVYVTYYKDTITWCPKDDAKKVETITTGDMFYRDILGDFKKNDNMLGVVFIAIVLIGAGCMVKLVVFSDTFSKE